MDTDIDYMIDDVDFIEIFKNGILNKNIYVIGFERNPKGVSKLSLMYKDATHTIKFEEMDLHLCKHVTESFMKGFNKGLEDWTNELL